MIEIAIGLAIVAVITAISRNIWAHNKRRRREQQTAFWRRVEYIND